MKGEVAMQALKRRRAVAKRSRHHPAPRPPPPVEAPRPPPPVEPPRPPPPVEPPRPPQPQAPVDEPEEDEAGRPSTGGRHGWRAVQVEGGWIRYSRILGRADALCSSEDHKDGPECKWDKKIVHGSLAMCLLWLAKGQGCCKKGHAELKRRLGGRACCEDRVAAKTQLMIDASDGSVDAADLLALDLEITGQDGEPYVVGAR